MESKTKTRLSLLMALMVIAGGMGVWQFDLNVSGVAVDSSEPRGRSAEQRGPASPTGAVVMGAGDRREIRNARDTAGVEMTSLRVQTKTMDASQLVALPNVRFVVHVASTEVLDVSFDPGFRVEGVSDDRGEAHVEVPVAALGRAHGWGARYLAGFVAEPGYTQSTSDLEFEGDPRSAATPDSMALRIYSQVGTTVRGRVLGGGGRLARIRAELESAESFDAMVEASSSGTTGEFEFDVPWTHGSLRVFAEVDQVGTGLRAGIGLDPANPPGPIEIVLEPGESLVGDLVDSQGRGVGGKRLFAVAAELEGIELDGEGRRRVSVNSARLGEGLVMSETTTTWGGQFQFDGLRPGDYFVRAAAAGSEEFPMLLTDVPVSTGSQRHTLMLRAPTLVVTIVKADGSPYTLTPRFRHALVDPLRPPKSGRRLAWRGMVTVGVIPIEPDRREPATPALEAEPMGGGKYRFEVVAGQDYEVGIRTQAQAWASTTLSMPASGASLEHTLVVGGGRAPGTLLLTVLDADGSVYGEDGSVEVSDGERGWNCYHLRTDPTTAWPLEVQLGAGDYRIQFTRGESSRSARDVGPRAPTYGARIRIESGGLTDHTARLEAIPESEFDPLSGRDGSATSRDDFPRSNRRGDG